MKLDRPTRVIAALCYVGIAYVLHLMWPLLGPLVLVGGLAYQLAGHWEKEEQ